jgi:predicted anti-sigma-YlaC factor YlaD
MQCDQATELMSARLDGELTRAEHGALDSHLSTCRACLALSLRLVDSNRVFRLSPTPFVPDLTASILARTPALGRGRQIARSLLWFVAVLQIDTALPSLVLGSETGATTHAARHLGAFEIAVAVGLLVAAWRPHRAISVLPIAATVGLTVTITAIADLISGDTNPQLEAHHLLQLLVWLLAGSPHPTLGGLGRRASVRRIEQAAR